MKNPNQHIDDELISKILSGEASDEEKAEFEEWLRESEDNKALFDAYKRVWDSPSMPDVDTEAAWGTTKNRLNIPRNRLHFRYRGWAVIAASFFIAAIAWLIWFGNQPEMVKLSALENNESHYLPDSSVVTLQKGASIAYKKPFARRLSLEGTAFFEINHQEGKSFLVEASRSTIEVLGTKFNVETDEYGGNMIFLLEGKVAVNNELEDITLAPGEAAYVGNADSEIKRVENEMNNALYWKSKTLKFQNSPLKVVFKTFEQLFDVNIEMSDSTIGNCRLSSSFKDSSLDDMLKVILEIHDLKMKKSEGRYEITGKGC